MNDANPDNGRKETMTSAMTFATAAEIPCEVARDLDRPGNQIGRDSTGLYPHISRKLLSRKVLIAPETLSKIFLGKRNRIRLDLAVRIAQAIGITVEQLNYDLDLKQREYQYEQKSRKVIATTSATASASASAIAAKLQLKEKSNNEVNK